MTQSSSIHILVAVVSLGMALMVPRAVDAQAAISGKVLKDADKKGLAGAEISIGALNRTTTSDSTGTFVLTDVSPGRYLITVRKVGYKQFSTMASILSADGPEYEFALAAAPIELAKVDVKADAITTHFSEFEERRAKRIGRYLTAEDFAKNDGRPVADIMLAVPGVSIIRGRGNEAWYASRRGAETITLHRKVSAADSGRGADIRACYATVVLNGQVVFSGANGQQLFDLNSLNARDIRGVEVYTGTANVPQQWLTGDGGCGVIAIWLK
ncbi:MAG: carboxypeptidase regulatory-like domain-containing protein [Gemmatimonadaceae bacterium]|nr:carboxypeptidase regulatory-like domain-containing protein [Gemmatimonadaceae bacterium]